MRFSVRTPERTLAGAERALDTARSKYSDAASHAAEAGAQKDVEIDALTQVISDKVARRSELDKLRDTAIEAATFLGAVVDKVL